jgi:hypothetical protein
MRFIFDIFSVEEQDGVVAVLEILRDEDAMEEDDDVDSQSLSIFVRVLLISQAHLR